MKTKPFLTRLHLVVAGASLFLAPIAIAQTGGSEIKPDKQRVIDHWTPDRRAAAIPRDLVIDPRGLGYLRLPNGKLQPYGHDLAAEAKSTASMSPRARPGSDSCSSAPPIVVAMDPSGGDTIGGSHTFSAAVTADCGIKSVSFKVRKGTNGLINSFTPNNSGGDTWSIGLQGFSDGSWEWWVEAKDNGPKGGTANVPEIVQFNVDVNGGGSGGDPGDGGSSSEEGVITNAAWNFGGAVQKAAGRIYFEMPSNSRWKRWNGYVCSGTVITDTADDRSIILTAAHCVYDDANKAFARNVLFIPNQAGTSGSGTDLNCNNDPYGCWTPDFGVVDEDWTLRTFPDNIAWDYAYYVVSNSDSHSGFGDYTALDAATGTLDVNFSEPSVDGSQSSFTHALGYSYSDDPNFMYCAENMTTEGTVNWWLPNCDLSGGSSGGLWVQPMDKDLGDGPIISVNSWGYTTSPGMAGPILHDTSAACLLTKANTNNTASSAEGEQGIVITLSDCLP